MTIQLQNRKVRLDESFEECERTYLDIRGSADGLRWFAKLLEECADSSSAVIISDHDFPPVNLCGFDAIDLSCNDEPN